MHKVPAHLVFYSPCGVLLFRKFDSLRNVSRAILLPRHVPMVVLLPRRFLCTIYSRDNFHNSFNPAMFPEGHFTPTIFSKARNSLDSFCVLFYPCDDFQRSFCSTNVLLGLFYSHDSYGKSFYSPHGP